MTSGIEFPSFRSRDGHLLGAVDDLVVTRMRGEPEFAVAFDELDMALPLGDVFLLLLPQRFGQVRDEFRGAGRRIVTVKLPAHVVTLGRQHIINPAVAGRRNGIIGVMRVRKTGINALGGHLSAHRSLPRCRGACGQERKGEDEKKAYLVHENNYSRYKIRLYWILSKRLLLFFFFLLGGEKLPLE